jgi:hypothetical protein
MSQRERLGTCSAGVGVTTGSREGNESQEWRLTMGDRVIADDGARSVRREIGVLEEGDAEARLHPSWRRLLHAAHRARRARGRWSHGGHAHAPPARRRTGPSILSTRACVHQRSRASRSCLASAAHRPRFDKQLRDLERIQVARVKQAAARRCTVPRRAHAYTAQRTRPPLPHRGAALACQFTHKVCDMAA